MRRLRNALLTVHKRLYYGYITLLSLPFRLVPRGGVEVMEEDWDNLIVLDACRYDAFSELNTIPGDLDRVKSPATSTPQWLKRNFTGKYEDVVYISGNPYVSDLANDGYFDAEEHFHHVEHVWDEGWDDELHTVPPEAINSAVERLKEEYPDRRFIVHYMQPHEPFLGETNFREHWPGGWEATLKIWKHPEVEKAYRENLKIVLDAVEDILPVLEGKTVVTSDHGEMFGKYGVIRHPTDVFFRELCEVPWLEVEDGDG